MSIGTALAIYFVVWWVTLFVTLPFRMKSQLELGSVTEGSDPAAPANPQLLKRMLWNSVLAAFVCFLFWLVFYYFGVRVEDLPRAI